MSESNIVEKLLGMTLLGSEWVLVAVNFLKCSIHSYHVGKSCFLL